MLDDTPTDESNSAQEQDAPAAPRKRTATRRTATTRVSAAAGTPPAEPEAITPDQPEDTAAPVKKAAAKKSAAKKSATKKTAAKKPAKTSVDAAPVEVSATEVAEGPAKPAKKAAKKSAKKTAKVSESAPTSDAAPAADDAETGEAAPAAVALPLFKAPEPTTAPRRRTRKVAVAEPETADGNAESEPDQAADEEADRDADLDDETGGPRRRRRRGGRRRRKAGDGPDDTNGTTEGVTENDQPSEAAATQDEAAGEEAGTEGTTRRRRRRRRSGDDAGEGSGDPEKTVTRVRQARSAEDQITAVAGSTRLEAKKQRRREGREAGRRRAPIVSEAEFLARRESVERVMVVRQREDLTQIAVLEDKVLVEHYVARESQTSLIGNVYLGRVQNVLPSMEAAFIDIGKGRNAVLYAGEVNWSSLGHKEGQPRKIESVLSSGQTVLVQVTKDPIGHKGARLTSQVSLAGRFLVYVPDGTTSGISRKLPDTERNRLKNLLREIVPDTAGVIVRTAAEGASEEELTRDVERLKARWEDIESKAKGNAPQLLYGEPDLMLKVVRDLFTEDFTRLVIQGDDAWDTVGGYIEHVAPDLAPRLERYERPASGADVFATYRLDEQIAKGLDRKVWLPSGGSLVIDRTEAMTVVDVNTGKFTGSGGNLEETVTKNNLEAAEEIVRQLRLRDIGGIIVIDFIDMVLESNRDLVLRRLVECLGRDRTRHQVAEVTSLGLVQMTRKRIGTGLLEAFSQQCDHCGGRGLIVLDAPAEPRRGDEEPRRARRGRTGRGRGEDGPDVPAPKPVPSPAVIAAAARHETVAPEGAAPEDLGPEELAPEGVEPEAAEDPAESAESAASVLDDEIVGFETDLEPFAEPEPGPESEPVEPESEPVEPEPVEPEPEPEPVEPVAPKVVTRTRRRSASRPAGPPPAPVAALDEPTLAGGVSGEIGVPSVTGLVEPGTADLEPGGAEAAHVEHVPVKKKGSRKR